MPGQFVRSELVENIINTVNKWNDNATVKSDAFEYVFVNEEEAT